jgi:drug/metabolite transporter (DMT)-like permease
VDGAARSRAVGYALALLAGCLWASLVVLGKLLVATGIDPVTMVGVRAAMAFLMLAGVLAVFNRRLVTLKLRDVPLFLGYGTCVAFNYALYFFAFKWTTGTMAVILMYTYPLFVALLAGVLLGERLDTVKSVALGLTLAGCFFVVQAYNRDALMFNLRGVLSGLGAALAMALYSIIGKKATARYNSWTVVMWGFGFGSLLLLASRVGDLGAIARIPSGVWGGIFLVALFPTLLAYAVFTRAMTHIEATRASITASIEPAVGAAAAWVFLGERLEALQWFGAAAVIGGVLLLQAVDLRRPAARQQIARRSVT